MTSTPGLSIVRCTGHHIELINTINIVGALMLIVVAHRLALIQAHSRILASSSQITLGIGNLPRHPNFGSFNLLCLARTRLSLSKTSTEGCVRSQPDAQSLSNILPYAFRGTFMYCKMT